jgi:hypothetical protein
MPDPSVRSSFTALSRRPLAAAGAIALGCWLAVTPGYAQESPVAPCAATAGIGRLVGTVTDPQGARVPGARVTVSCPTGDRTTLTDANGTFALELGPGTHVIVISKD